MNLKERVYEVVQEIPKGRVASYGDVAALAGSPRAGRVVGQIAKRGPSNFPWHRVVRSNGHLAQGFAWGGAEEQKRMLESEGIKFTSEGKIAHFKKLRINTYE